MRHGLCDDLLLGGRRLGFLRHQRFEETPDLRNLSERAGRVVHGVAHCHAALPRDALLRRGRCIRRGDGGHRRLRVLLRRTGQLGRRASLDRRAAIVRLVHRDARDDLISQVKFAVRHGWIHERKLEGQGTAIASLDDELSLMIVELIDEVNVIEGMRDMAIVHELGAPEFASRGRIDGSEFAVIDEGKGADRVVTVVETPLREILALAPLQRTVGTLARAGGRTRRRCRGCRSGGGGAHRRKGSGREQQYGRG